MSTNACKYKCRLSFKKCFACSVICIMQTALACLAIIFSYYIILPIINLITLSGINAIHTDAQLLRNYYTSISATTSYFASVLGISLGFYYYINKNKIEAQRVLQAKIDKNLEFLLNKYEQINCIVTQITSFSWENQSQLDRYRRELQEAILDVQDILECNDRITMLNSEEVSYFHKLNSFLDNNSNIMKNNADTLYDNKGAFKEDIAEYLDKLSDARRFIYNKAKSIA